MNKGQNKCTYKVHPEKPYNMGNLLISDHLLQPPKAESDHLAQKLANAQHCWAKWPGGGRLRPPSFNLLFFRTSKVGRNLFKNNYSCISGFVFL